MGFDGNQIKNPRRDWSSLASSAGEKTSNAFFSSFNQFAQLKIRQDQLKMQQELQPLMMEKYNLDIQKSGIDVENARFELDQDKKFWDNGGFNQKNYGGSSADLGEYGAAVSGFIPKQETINEDYIPREGEPEVRRANSADPNENLQWRGYQDTDPNKLAEKLPEGMKGLAPYFVEAGKKYDVDPLGLAAISQHETGNGTSSAFRNKNNAMGISDSSGPKTQNSAAASIDKMASTLSKADGYYAGKNTIGEISGIYAPVGASNDPNGTNGSWGKDVGSYYKNLMDSVRS